MADIKQGNITTVATESQNLLAHVWERMVD
jgi:hypothetical protein